MLNKIKEKDFHQSMRGYFAGLLYNEMIDNKDIFVITGDLGFGLFNKIRKDFSSRFYNVGASEQAGSDIACGLAMAGRTPIFYSITTFLLYRPFETLRTYINYEKLNVKLIGSGRDQDYLHDGISHWSEDARAFLKPLRNIQTYWPEKKEEMSGIVKEMLERNGPVFVSLRR